MVSSGDQYVALIQLSPPQSIVNYAGYNHGLGQLAAILEQSGWQCHLHVVSREKEVSAVQQLLVGKTYACALIYLGTNQWYLFKSLVEPLADRAIPIFVGGPHATAKPLDLFDFQAVTAVGRFEGEAVVVQLVENRHDLQAITELPNVVSRLSSEHHAQPEYIKNLDSLPFVNRDIFGYEKYLHSKQMSIMGMEVLTGRGCPYSCRYCFNTYYSKKGIPLRRRSVDHVIDEILCLKQKFNYQGIIGFQDDVFTLDNQWLQQFAAAYKKNINLPFWCNAHVKSLNAHAIKLLRQAGCVRIQIGIESGNYHLRKKVLGKTFTNEEALEVVRIMKRHHIKVVANFMLGLPGENREGLEETLQFCKTLSPHWILLSTLCPYPGTDLYNQLVQDKQLPHDFYKHITLDSYYSPHFSYEHEVLSNDHLRDYYEAMYACVKK